MSDPVTRLNAALEGRYGIERELGEGGMATVYLADDLKHNRKGIKPRTAPADSLPSSASILRRRAGGKGLVFLCTRCKGLPNSTE